MNKHLLFIIIGTAMGIFPELILLLLTGRYQLGYDFIILALLVGGIPASISGWIGGAIVKKKWGAVLGGFVGSILGILFVLQPS